MNLQFNFDRLSFWIGVLVGSLIWWLLNQLKKLLPEIKRFFKEQSDFNQRRRNYGLEEEIRKEVLIRAQEAHLANRLFSLDEILITPRFLAPPPHIEPGSIHFPDDTQSQVLPYLPDWPELPSLYGSTTLSPQEVVQSNHNFAIISPPGYGKTTMLAYITSIIARRSELVGETGNKLPLFLHIADFILAPDKNTEPFEILLNAFRASYPDVTNSNLANFLYEALDSGRSIVLIDGLDEMPPDLLTQITGYLYSFHEQFPSSQIIVAASPDNLNGLPGLGFQVIPVAAWNHNQRLAFIDQWIENWTGVITPHPEIDPLLLKNWLLYKIDLLSPLELTLKTWGAFTGTLRGGRAADAIDSYLQLIIPEARSRPAFQKLALQMMVNTQPIITQRSAVNYIRRQISNENPDAAEITLEKIGQENIEKTKASKSKSPIGISLLFPSLIEEGLLTPRANNRIGFEHIVLAGYLAGKSLADTNLTNKILAQPAWSGKSQTLHYLATCVDVHPIVDDYIRNRDDPLFRELFTAARWLQDAPARIRWRNNLMVRLFEILNQENFALGIRARALSAFVFSGDPSVIHLFRQLLASPSSIVRQLAVLGIGAVRDPQCTNDLISVLNDPESEVRMAACLALVALGTNKAMEAVASALLSGDENVRRAAAEAFANNPKEGYPILKDGLQMDDVLVRRAVVYGLQRVAEPWAIELLEKVRMEDNQWVVRNAAEQAIETHKKPHPAIPHPLPSPADTPWLVTFAGKHGLGIAGGGYTATEMLLKALKTGIEEQQLSSLDYLRDNPDPGVIGVVYNILFTDRGIVREIALNTIWYMAACGASLPSPMQYGF